MAPGPLSQVERESFLLELLHLAGWELRVRPGESMQIRASRGDVELDVTGASLAQAAGVVFARAMRSSRSIRRPEDG
jgi:hypothetical protein